MAEEMQTIIIAYIEAEMNETGIVGTNAICLENPHAQKMTLQVVGKRRIWQFVALVQNLLM